MNNSAKATTAAMRVGSAIRQQIKQLHERDGVGVTDISTMLGIPAPVVADILGEAVEAVADEQSDRIRVAEDGLTPHMQLAINTLAQVCEYAESDAVRLAAAEKILNMSTGSLRPAKIEAGGGITIATMNNLIIQATTAHAAQLAEVKKPSTEICVESVRNN